MARGVTERDLLDAIAEVQRARVQDDDDALTAREIAGLVGCSYPRALDIIRRLLAAGLVECVRVSRVRMDGVVTLVSAYRLVRERAAPEGRSATKRPA
ncbi:MAG TPA: hypothetical protein VIL25_10930 [Vicinamibacterales bacterium]